MDHEVTNRRRRHVEPQRLPTVSIVERKENCELRSGKQQTTFLWIFLDCVDRTIRQASDNLLPTRSAILRAIDVRFLIVKANSIYSDVCGVEIEVACIDL